MRVGEEFGLEEYLDFLFFFDLGEGGGEAGGRDQAPGTGVGLGVPFLDFFGEFKALNDQPLFLGLAETLDLTEPAFDCLGLELPKVNRDAAFESEGLRVAGSIDPTFASGSVLSASQEKSFALSFSLPQLSSC